MDFDSGGSVHDFLGILMLLWQASDVWGPVALRVCPLPGQLYLVGRILVWHLENLLWLDSNSTPIYAVIKGGRRCLLRLSIVSFAQAPV